MKGLIKGGIAGSLVVIILFGFLLLSNQPVMGDPSPPTGYVERTENSLILRPSPPRNVTLEETGTYYRLSNDYAGVEIYKGTYGYNVYYDRDFEETKIYNERVFLEYWTGSKWKPIGTPQSTELVELDDGYSVTRLFTDFIGTNYNVTYTLKKGSPLKMSINLNGSAEREYRVNWDLNGIAGLKQTKSGNKYIYGEDKDNRSVIIDYDDVYQSFGDITSYENTTSAQGRKANFYFLVGLTNNFTLDPTILTDGVGTMYVAVDDDNLFAGSYTDGNVYVWNIPAFDLNTTLTDCGTTIYDVHADSKYVYAGCDDGKLYIWYRRNFTLTTTIAPATTDAIIAVHSDGTYVYLGQDTEAGHGNHLFRACTKADFTSCSTVSQDSSNTYRGAFVDSNYVYSGSLSGSLYVDDVGTWNDVTTLGQTGSILEIFADTTYLYTGGYGGMAGIYIYLISDWSSHHNISQQDPTGDIDGLYSYDDIIFGGGNRGRIYMYNISGGFSKFGKNLSASEVRDIKVDGDYIYSSGETNQVYVFNRIPTPSSPSTSPTNIYVGSTIDCSVTVSDEINYTVDIQFTWYKNGTNIETYNTSIYGCEVDSSCNSNYSVTETLTLDDTWICSARAWNGINWSSWFNSSAKTVKGTIWDDRQYRYEIHSNATSVMPINVNDTDFPDIWTLNATLLEKKYLYCNVSICADGQLTIGNATNETAWENETGSGVDIGDVWDSNYVTVFHMYNDSGTNIRDSTGRASGTSSGKPLLTTGLFGEAIQFDGSDDIISFTGYDLDTGDFTFEAWVKTANDFSGGEGTIYGYFDGSTFNPGFEIFQDNMAKIHLDTKGDNDCKVEGVGPVVNDNAWHHLVAVRDSGVLILYVDDAEIGRDTSGCADEDLTALSSSYIGERSDGATYFTGLIDEFRISDTARSVAYINETYWNGVGNLTFLGTEKFLNETPIVNLHNITGRTSDNTPGIYFNFTDDDIVARCYLLMNGTAYDVNATTKNDTQTTLIANATRPEDDYNITIICSDKVRQNASDSIILTIDTTPPIFSNNRTNITPNEDQEVLLNITIDDANGNVSGVLDVIVEIVTNAGTTNYTVVTNKSNEWYFYLESGNYTAHDEINWTWYATDDLGNLNASIMQNFTVVNRVPTVPSHSTPTTNNWSINHTVALIWSASTDADDEDTITYYLYINDTLNTSTESTTVSLWFNEGQYNWNLTADDGYANSSKSAHWYFRVDTLDPAIALNTPANSSYQKTGVIIDLDITDTNAITSFYSIDDYGSNTSLSSPWDIDTDGFSEAETLFDVWATDEAGNMIEKQYNFTLDDTPPTITFSNVNNSYNDSGITILVSIHDTNIVSGSSVWSKDNWATNDTTFNISTTDWDEGCYTVWVFAKDSADNMNSNSLNITIDDTAPTVTFMQVNGTYNNTDTTILVSILETNPDHSVWSKDSYATNYTTFNISTSGWAEGEYAVDVYSKDQAKHVTQKTLNITIDDTDPTITFVFPVNGTYNRSGVPIQVSFFDTNIVSGSAVWSIDDWATNYTTFNISTTGWADGEYETLVFIKDSADNMVVNALNITIDDTDPVITFMNVNGTYNTSGGDILVSFFDTNLNTTLWSYDDWTTNSTTFNISTTGWAEQEHIVLVYANDSAGNFKTNTFNITIDDTNPTIDILYPANGTFNKSGVPIKVSFFDTNINTTLWSNDNWATNDTTFNISTTGWSDGEYVVLIFINDSARNTVTDTFNITIDDTEPTLSNNETNVTPHEDQDVMINITITETGSGIDDVYIEFTNNTHTINYTMFNVGLEYYMPFDNGNYTAHDNISWYFYANDTVGNLNRSRIFYITITNQLPTHSLPILNTTTDLNKSTDNLDCWNVSTADDDDEDTVINIYRWYKDNARQDSLENFSTVTSGNTSIGEDWICEVIPFEGYSNGTYRNTTILTIQNTIPVVDGVNIQHDNRIFNSVLRGINISVRANISDADGSADIDDILINITNPEGTVRINRSSMEKIIDLTNGGTYQFNFSISTWDKNGTWNISVQCNDSSDASDTNSTNLSISSLVITVGATIQGNSQVDVPTNWERGDSINNPLGDQFMNIMANLTLPCDTVEVNLKNISSNTETIMETNTTYCYLTTELPNLNGGSTIGLKIFYNTSTINKSESNSTIGFDFVKYINCSINYTSIEDFYVWTLMDENATGLHLYTNNTLGGWTEITTSADYLFTSYDLNNNTLTDNVSWVIKDFDGTYLFKLTGTIGWINTTINRTITSGDVTEAKLIDWLEEITFLNNNSYSVSWIFRARLPDEVTEVEVDGVLKAPYFDNLGKYVLLEDSIASETIVYHQLNYSTPPVSSTSPHIVPSVFYVNENSIVTINVSVQNHVSLVVENVKKDVQIVAGESLLVCEGWLSCNDSISIAEENFVTGTYSIDVGNISAKSLKLFTIRYEIKTATAEHFDIYRKNLVVDGIEKSYSVELVKITVIASSTLQNLHYIIEEINISQVQQIKNLRTGVLYDFTSGSLDIEIGTVNPGEIIELEIFSQPKAIPDVIIPWEYWILVALAVGFFMWVAVYKVDFGTGGRPRWRKKVIKETITDTPLYEEEE